MATVYIVGSSTGKDGIHGATFASADLTEDSMEDLPAVQVGDPFQEKLLLEATLELAVTDTVIGMQDMGAAGIICSTSEMSEKGKHGMIIDLDKVPTRQANMKPFEILLSESQERMLVVVKKGQEKPVEDIFEKWDLNAVQIGEVTEGDRLEFFMDGKKVADVPASELVLGGGAPVYEREYTEPAYFKEAQEFDIDAVPIPLNLKDTAYELLNLPNIGSKKWVIEQYDTMVGTRNMSTNAPSDAGITNIKGSKKALALTVDCNARYVFADPLMGTSIAVSEAARNIVCSGGVPSAVTNCLNFGNPYNPEVYWQFVGAIKGMSEACEKFQTPVTGGNVSFYNQTVTEEYVEPVFPTPTIGMVGIVEDKKNIMTLNFKNEGEIIFLLGESRNDINSSEYLANLCDVKITPAPFLDLNEELMLHEVVKKLIENKMINSAHDVSDGGLWTCLVEKGLQNDLGFDIEADDSVRMDAFLFGESQSRVVVSLSTEQQPAFIEFLTRVGQSFNILGSVTNGSISIDGEDFGTISEAKKVYEKALSQHL